MKKVILTTIVVSLFAVSCSGGKKLTNMTGALNTKWTLQSLSGQNNIAALFGNRVPFLNFDTKAMHLSGNSGCNNLSGSFSVLTRNKISLGPLASTKMACPGNGESVFLSALGKVTHFTISNGVLKLLNGKEELMSLVKAG